MKDKRIKLTEEEFNLLDELSNNMNHIRNIMSLYLTNVVKNHVPEMKHNSHELEIDPENHEVIVREVKKLKI